MCSGRLLLGPGDRWDEAGLNQAIYASRPGVGEPGKCPADPALNTEIRSLVRRCDIIIEVGIEVGPQTRQPAPGRVDISDGPRGEAKTPNRSSSGAPATSPTARENQTLKSSRDAYQCFAGSGSYTATFRRGLSEPVRTD